tara:strand:- start:3394 stop:4035 length:642 start_codon:yes stop_codon:yes gene_type:complete
MIFSGMSSLADSFRKPWAVIKTTNIHAYSQANGEPAQYVWLIDQYATLDDDFSLSWLPDSEEIDMCHVFMKVNDISGHDIKPIAILVPTNPNRRSKQKNHTQPAQTERNRYCIYVKIDRTSESRTRFKAFADRWSNVSPLFINNNDAMNKGVLRSLTTKYAWIIEPEQQFVDDWDFSFSPDHETPQIYIMPNGVKLYPKDYFLGVDDITIDQR